MCLLVLCSDQDSEIWSEVEGRRTLMKSVIASFVWLTSKRKMNNSFLSRTAFPE
jgi:hypothetical protein